MKLKRKELFYAHKKETSKQASKWIEWARFDSYRFDLIAGRFPYTYFWIFIGTIKSYWSISETSGYSTFIPHSFFLRFVYLDGSLVCSFVVHSFYAILFLFHLLFIFIVLSSYILLVFVVYIAYMFLTICSRSYYYSSDYSFDIILLEQLI